MEVVITKEFEERYQNLPLVIQRKAEKQERLFRKNPFYPSLHTEKIQPKQQQLWTFRVDKHYRILFRFLDNKKALFLTVGSHDQVYHFPL